MSVTSSDWLQAQYSVLGAVLIEPTLAPKMMVETQAADFSGACQTVYDAMRQLFTEGKPVDVVSVNAQLGGQYREFLMQLMQITPTAANLDHYISLCRDQARILAVRDIGQQLSAAECIDNARHLLEAGNSLMISSCGQKTVGMSDCLRAFMERPEGKPDFLSWPIEAFNSCLRVKPGKFILIGAEPSVGKTAFALQCAYHWAKSKKIGFFSLETDPETLFDRLMASVTGIPLERIQDGKITSEEWDCICQMSTAIISRGLDFIPAAGLSTADISAKIVEGQYDVIVIDYLQLIPASGASRYEIVTNVSIALHQIAQRYKVTIVALSQLSRSPDDHIPRNSDLRESGQLEQDADIIIMLKLEKQSEPSGPRKAFVTKHKEGELFMTILDFDGKHQTFRKAQGGSQAAQKYIDAGKKARRQNAQKSRQEHPGQFSLLEGEDPNLPF